MNSNHLYLTSFEKVCFIVSEALMGDFGERPSPIVPLFSGLRISPNFPAKVLLVVWPFICRFSFSCCRIMSLKLFGELALVAGRWKRLRGLTVAVVLVVVSGVCCLYIGFWGPLAALELFLELFLDYLLALFLRRSENFFGD